MDPRDANKTAFVCHRGTFRCKEMPFGLCNAPAIFQRLMDIVMAGLNFEICLVCLDDNIVFSQSLRQHLERLRTLFELLRQTDLKLKPSNCHLMQRIVTFWASSSAKMQWKPIQARLMLCGTGQRQRACDRVKVSLVFANIIDASCRDFALSPHPSTPKRGKALHSCEQLSVSKLSTT